jgi:hypothetical protein
MAQSGSVGHIAEMVAGMGCRDQRDDQNAPEVLGLQTDLPDGLKWPEGAHSKRL